MSNKLIKTRKQAVSEFFNRGKNLHVVEINEVDIDKIMDNARQVIVMAENDCGPIEWSHPEYVTVGGGDTLLIFPGGISNEQMKLMKKSFNW